MFNQSQTLVRININIVECEIWNPWPLLRWVFVLNQSRSVAGPNFFIYIEVCVLTEVGIDKALAHMLIFN